MATKNADLTDSDVTARLESYDDPNVTSELYEFGTMMLNDSVARIGKMDTKAAALAVYSGGLITLLVATRDAWTRLQHAQVVLLQIAAAALALAALAAIASMSLQKTEWFTQNEWLKAECLSSPDMLRRYHVLTMLGVVRSHHRAYRKKLCKIYVTQFLLAIGVICLFIALL